MSSHRGVFVTGTGTEVGKTMVACALAREATERGQTVGVYKPAVSGLDEYAASRLPADHELLRLAARSDQSDEEIAPYRYGPPVSPHLAAELAGERIDTDRLLAAARAAASRCELLVCEGVGGLLVPLTPEYLVRDLAAELAYPVVIAASPGLGTINHTLLTVEAARAAGLEVASVVLSPWPEDPGTLERSNREAIAGIAEVHVSTLGRMDTAGIGPWPAVRPTPLRAL